MIVVTCRNGERYSLDPDAIARVETDPDTVVTLVDGTRYVVDQSFDEVLHRIRERRAALVTASMQLTRTAVRPRPPQEHRSAPPVVVLPRSGED